MKWNTVFIITCAVIKSFQTTLQFLKDFNDILGKVMVAKSTKNCFRF